MVTLRAALIGSGRMGGEIQEVAEAHDVEIVHVLDAAGMMNGGEALLREVDVALEFTRPDAAVDNIRRCLDARCPVVVGTSGWYDRISDVRTMTKEADGAVLWAENFSPGYALMKGVVERLAALGASFDGYDIHLVETHHAAKRDAPSGTAVRLRAATERAAERSIEVTSIRTGHVPGEHELVVDGPFDRVALQHRVRDRRVFADGALRAARWLVGRTGFFSIEDWVGIDA
ncbi:MAG: dihydrodipicolinate reductase C-terminal domain-containing protein [Gemmatimonadota bacterium]